jgi:type IV secretion system protein VirD4
VEPQDRITQSDLDRRERRWRWELENQTRAAKRRLDDSATRASRDLDRQVREARRRAAAPGAATGAGPTRPSGGMMGGRSETDWQSLDDKLLIWALPVTALAALPLVVGHLAALLAHGDWPSYRLAEAPGIVGRIVTEPGDPGRAWEPVNTGAAVPGPVVYWGMFAFVAVVVGLVALLVWAATRPPAGRGGVGWAAPESLRDLWPGKKGDDRLVMGVSGGHKLTVRDRHGLLVVGPAHSGKTSGVTVPAILEWRGPMVVATSKGHLIDETIGWRSHKGDVHVYDPAAVTRYHRSGWSPLADCDTWDRAIRTAADLTLAARASIGASDHGDGIIVEGRGDLWRSSMSMSLAPFLLAAVASGKPVGTAAEWIETEERDEVLEILQGVDRAAARAHRMTFTRPSESRSHFLHAMHEILSVYEDPVVAASMDRHDIEPDELLDGGAHTLYLTTPEHDQDRLRPLCAMIVRRVLAAAYEKSARSGARLNPPLLVVLDDVPGVAPVYNLAALASTGAARGVQIVSVFQDLAQIDEHYGDAADLVVKNHRARLVLPSGPGRTAGGLDRLVAPELMLELGEGEAALLYGTNAPARVRLRPWFRDRELRRRAETPQDAVRPAEPEDRGAPLTVAEQYAIWARRASGETVAGVEDPTIPLDRHDPGYVEVFGSLDDDTMPHNVTPLSDQRRHRW